MDNAGNIYIADSDEELIRRVDATTKNISTITLPRERYSLGRLATDKNGNILVADTGQHMVHRIDAATGILTTIAGTGQQADGGQEGGPIGAGDGGLAVDAQLNQPIGVAVDHDGNILITEWYGYRLRKIDITTGNITTIAHLHNPSGVTVDAAGNILVTESLDRDRVVRVDAVTGAITVVATGLSRPRGIIMDANDNILVAVADSSQIVRFGIQR